MKIIQLSPLKSFKTFFLIGLGLLLFLTPITSAATKSKAATAKDGKIVVVHYTGWLHDTTKPENKGAKFDSSRDKSQPFSFTLGKKQVIKGWDKGVKGMKVGERKTLVIPPEDGYGTQGFPGAIPPNATLLFDVELLEVNDPPPTTQKASPSNSDG